MTLAVAFAGEAALAGGGARPGKCARPWVFFDLGETLVDTKTSDFKALTFMPGAREYVRHLARKGYPMGLIVNIPANWGRDRAERVATLVKFIDEKWADPAAFDWKIFGERILVPNSDGERKPHPALFQEAQALATAAHCPAVYEGEDATEIKVAAAERMTAYQVFATKPNVFMPEGLIRKLQLPRSSPSPIRAPLPEPLAVPPGLLEL